MITFFNPIHLTKNYSEQFTKAKPFLHIHLKNILKLALAQKLLTQLKKETFIEKESDLFSLKQTHDLHFARSHLLKQFHKSLLTAEFFAFLEETTQIPLQGKLHLAGTRYDSTDHLLCHDDKLEKRKIALLFYLSQNFTKKDGGTLQLFNTKKGQPTNRAKSIKPEFNSLVLFKVSQKSFHAVEENYSNNPRYTLGGWAQ